MERDHPRNSCFFSVSKCPSQIQTAHDERRLPECPCQFVKECPWSRRFARFSCKFSTREKKVLCQIRNFWTTSYSFCHLKRLPFHLFMALATVHVMESRSFNLKIDLRVNLYSTPRGLTFFYLRHQRCRIYFSLEKILSQSLTPFRDCGIFFRIREKKYSPEISDY